MLDPTLLQNLYGSTRCCSAGSNPSPEPLRVQLDAGSNPAPEPLRVQLDAGSNPARSNPAGSIPSLLFDPTRPDYWIQPVLITGSNPSSLLDPTRSYCWIQPVFATESNLSLLLDPTRS